jgi:hypothetical protein
LSSKFIQGNQFYHEPHKLRTFGTNELAIRKTIFTFKFHEIKKKYEGFTANIGVKVRGRTEGTLRVVSGKLFKN